MTQSPGAEFVDSVDAAFYRYAAGKVEGQIHFDFRRIGLPELFGADLLGDFAALNSLDFEAVSGRQVMFAAEFVEGFFEQIDEVAVFVREPSFQRLVQDRVR